MDEKKLMEMFTKALSENKDALVAEATAAAIKAVEEKGINLNKSDLPQKCVFNTDTATRSKAPFVAISQEVNDFANDIKTIIRATRAGGNFDVKNLIRQKAFNETDDNDGGYFVPDEVGEGIIRFMVGEHSICAEAVSRGIVERIEKKM